MADNIRLNPGVGGRELAARDHGNVMHQRVLPQHLVGDIPTDVDPNNPLPVATQSPMEVVNPTGQRLNVMQDAGPDFLRYAKYYFLKDSGGNSDANGDYSVTPGVFYVDAPPNAILEVDRLGLFMATDSPLDSDGYGDIATPLTNGLNWRVTRDNGATVVWEIFPSTDRIISNLGLWFFAIQSDSIEYSQGMTTWAYNKWQFPTHDLKLSGPLGDRLEIYLTDDFTSHLNDQIFTIDGSVYGVDGAAPSDPDL